MKKIIFFLFLSLKGFCQENYDIYTESFQILNQGNYLGYVEYFEKNKDKLETPELLGDAYSFVGNYPYALKIYHNEHMMDELKAEKNKFDAKDYSKFRKTEKKDVFKALENVDFLLVNEGHHRNFHRIFLRDNLKELYQLGFRNLYVEAVNASDSINTRKYPTINTLITYPEPVFAEMIREAKAVGFNVYGYDCVEELPEFKNSVEEWNYRENIQYQNIIKQFNGEKSIVYGGYSHIITHQNNSKYNYLGALLKKNHKVLSIDQTTFIEEHTKDLEKQFYTENENVSAPVFFKNDEISSYDYTLIHPRTKLIEGKPDWLVKNKTKGTLKWKNTDNSNSIIIQVYKKDEYNKDANQCIPVYQYIENANSKELPYYFTDKSNEIVIIRNSANKILLKKELKNLE